MDSGNTFGESLRRERELRGVTLLELAEATKISTRYITALETCRFDQLPGGVFNRSFVRAIARYLKLDQDYWVGAYVRAAREESEILDRYALSAPAPSRSYRGALSFLFLLVIFGVAAYATHSIRLERARQAAARAETSSVAAPGDPTPSAGDAPTGSVLPVPARPVSLDARPPSSPMNAAAAEVDGRPLRLQVDVLGNAWLDVAVDGQSSFQGLMQPGETRTFRAAEIIDLTTGNASAVVLTLNGETLAPLGNPGERKRVRLTTQDLHTSQP